MSRSRTHGVLLIAWLLTLAAMAAFALRSLHISTDLRSFMPPPRTAEQKLLMEQIGEGPGTRLLLLAIDGAAGAQLANLSRGLAEALRQDASQFEQVINGAFDPAALDDELLPYRYLLSPTLDAQAFDAAFLGGQLQQRVEELASPAAALLKPLLPRDPTLETLALAERWSPPKAPALRDGVWFSSEGAALLLAETRGAGFDPAAQGAAIDALESAFDALPDRGEAKLTISGPGYFTVRISEQTRAEADRIGVISTIGFVLLLLLAYRSIAALLLAALPVVSGGLAGIAALALIFGGAHGITLAFGFTLLGVAQEYPIRLLSHRRAGEGAVASARALWPLLATAIVSAAIAYLAFFASGVAGLQQLAVFTIAGLLVAGFTTRYALPRVLPTRFRDVADSRALAAATRWLDRMPRPRWLPWLLLVVGLLVAWRAPGPLWQNDLAALTPVPPDLLLRDAKLRGELGAPDVRYLLVLRAADADGVLALSESIEPKLAELVERGALEAAELPSRYLPSLATQRMRQSKLPESAALESALAEARRELPFRADLFAPFRADVERARALPPLGAERFAKSPFGARLASMLVARDDGWLGLATLSGVRDAAALAVFADSMQGRATLLDLKAASESLVVAYRERILHALGLALGLLALTVVVALKSFTRAWHVLAPMSLATVLVFVVERAAGISLSLFHLVALTLAAGLGLHYALFFERPVADAAEARRTLHATLVCVLSALLVFGLQAWSSLPVLRAIGLTVALGVGFHFCLSILMARPHAPKGAPSPPLEPIRKDRIRRDRRQHEARDIVVRVATAADDDAVRIDRGGAVERCERARVVDEVVEIVDHAVAVNPNLQARYAAAGRTDAGAADNDTGIIDRRGAAVALVQRRAGDFAERAVRGERDRHQFRRLDREAEADDGAGRIDRGCDAREVRAHRAEREHRRGAELAAGGVDRRGVHVPVADQPAAGVDRGPARLLELRVRILDAVVDEAAVGGPGEGALGRR